MKLAHALPFAALASAWVIDGRHQSEHPVRDMANAMARFTSTMAGNPNLFIDEIVAATGELHVRLKSGVETLKSSGLNGPEHVANLLWLGQKLGPFGRSMHESVVGQKETVERNGYCYIMEHAVDAVQTDFYSFGDYMGGAVPQHEKAAAASYAEGILTILNDAKAQFTKDHCTNASPPSA
ncbi:hypothetical protein RJ55_07535 [Drechmeria coniospora]|nr:hypothetical protein RJ55_07535 [Drechmeria coniospora]